MTITPIMLRGIVIKMVITKLLLGSAFRRGVKCIKSSAAKTVKKLRVKASGLDNV